MQLIRYCERDGQVFNGWLLEDKVGRVDGSLFGEYRRMEATLPLEKVRLLPPVLPGKIIGVDYYGAGEQTGPPQLFLKPVSALAAPGEAVCLPPQSQQVEHEAELAVVMGRRGRWVTTEDAPAYILGYTIANDITARDLLTRDGQWMRAKAFDTFCPLGPWIETDFDPVDALISCYVNGQLRQMGSTRDLPLTVAQLVAYVTSIMTVEPGDVLLMGTLPGADALWADDQVEVKIDGIGTLANPVTVDKHHA